MSLEKVSILGVGITPTDYEEVCRTVRTWVLDHRNGTATRGRSIFACAVHAVMSGVLEKETKALLNSSSISTPDGMAVAWAMRSFGVQGQTRVYGPTLMLRLCKQAAELGHGVYLYGGRDASVPATADKMQLLFPGIQIVGIHPRRHPPSTPQEDTADVERIRESGADIVFVGFGAPRQERWIASHSEVLPGVVMVGVGAAFDFHAGRVKQAPEWMQNAGLEWFFRLMMEPHRLWRRYVLLNPLFVLMWSLQKLRIVRYPL